mmetsp:Transcript_15608/g.29048  ORF Transcript_15608/g.29048 Transcript_15608/m.29048 type:complete len:87 (+) Transcript_15608:94-354(+)
MEMKVDKTHYIIVLSDEVKRVVDMIQKHPDKVDDGQLDIVVKGLAVDDIFADKVGDKASHQQLHAGFGTTDKEEIVKKIIMEGKYH